MPRSRWRGALLAAAVTAAGCGGGARPAAAPAVPTLQPGKLVACSDVPYAPFEFERDGQLVGIDVDIVRAVAADLGLTAEFRDTSFDDIFSALEAERCDLVASSVSVTPEREAKYAFSAGYFEVSQSLLVRKADAATRPDLPSLAGRAVGVQEGTTGAAFARAHAPGAEVVEFAAVDELLDALRRGQVDGVVQDFPINSHDAATRGDTEVVRVFDEAEREEYGLVMAKGAGQLKAAIDATLAAMRDDGRYDAVLEEYLGAGRE